MSTRICGHYLRLLSPEYASYTARVRKWSTIWVDSRSYSVPSRLIGVKV